MDSEARHPDAPGRLRVVDLPIGSDRPLHLGGGFACVLAAAHARRAAARWIATTIAGPPPPGSGDATDIDDELMSMQQRHSPLLPLRAPAVLDLDVLRALWRADCSRRLELMAATQASHLSQRQRIDAALESAHDRPAPPAAGRRADAPSDLTDFKAAAKAYVRVQSLLAEAEALPPEPPSEALEIADAWEANVELLRQGEAIGAPTGKPAETPERRARPAPIAETATSGAVSDEVRAELERLHRAVVKAETRIFTQRRGPRNRAVKRYNAAVAAERIALANAGVDSYATFLLGADERELDHDDRARRAPDEEPAADSDELHAENDDLGIPRREALTARSDELRTRARALLGHEPGDDLASELRALPTDAPTRADPIRKIADCLRGAGIDVLDDVMGQARAFLQSPPSVHIPQAPTWPMMVPGSVVPLGEVERLEQQRVEQEDLLEEIGVEMLRLDTTRDSDLVQLAPSDFVRVIEAMLDAYRAGEVLEGRLPLVLDGVLDGLDVEVRDAAVLALADADDAQIIVVTDDAEVTKRVSDAGGTIVRWPEP
jgi:hypothetical protein